MFFQLILRCQTGEVLPDRVLLSRRVPPHPLVPLGRTNDKNSSWLSLSLLNMESVDRNKSRYDLKNNQVNFFKFYLLCESLLSALVLFTRHSVVSA